MAGLGSTISNILLPGLSLGTNAAGLAKASKDKKAAQAMIVPEVDWRQQQVFDSLQQQKRGLETGSAYAPQQAAITQQGLGAINAVTGVAGGDVGATIDAIAKVNRGTGRTMNELYGGMNQENVQLQGLIANTAQQMSERSYQILVSQKAQAMADAMKRKQQYAQNLTTAMTDVFGGGIIESLLGGKKKTDTQSTGIASGNVGGIVGALSGGAKTGATIGSVIPGLGTLAGGAVGGIVGALSGLFKKE